MISDKSHSPKTSGLIKRGKILNETSVSSFAFQVKGHKKRRDGSGLGGDGTVEEESESSA